MIIFASEGSLMFSKVSIFLLIIQLCKHQGAEHVTIMAITRVFFGFFPFNVVLFLYAAVKTQSHVGFAINRYPGG